MVGYLLCHLFPNGDFGALATIFFSFAHSILAVRNKGNGHTIRQSAVFQNDLRGQRLRDRDRFHFHIENILVKTFF